MGNSTYSHTDYAARAAYRAQTNTPVFQHHAAVASGKAHGVHPTLSPRGVKLRESRDSDEHPVTLPIGVIMDTSGSMAEVPPILEKALSKLMGTFLDDKASGKRYLGDAYPAILIGAVDNIKGIGADGCLQVGQFESGIEIDNNLENLWLTQHGGDPIHESYDLALYFFARHTVHDNWEKRGRKGYLFIIGDEVPFAAVTPGDVQAVIGAELESSIKLTEIVKEVSERYEVFFIIPNLSNNYNDPQVFKTWQGLLGERVLKLEDPAKVCELIAATVAICEENVGLDDLATDDLGGVSTALVAVAAGKSSLAKVSADALPVIAGDAGEVERL
jgi:hypothetical protein